MTLFLKLLLAHLIADFWLQPAAWVTEKERKRHRSSVLYLHAGIHGILSFIAIWNLSLWLPALVIAGTHWVIDLAKVSFQRGHNRSFWFFLDQLLHVTVIAMVSLVLVSPGPVEWLFPWQDALLIATAIVFLTSPSSAIIRIIISQWTPDTLHSVSSSLPDAGKFIGYLERFLVFLFILFGRWEAVGFLLAAKSVFRFGDLKEAQDRKLTEYVLIGTMLSFIIALLTALATSRLSAELPNVM